DRLIDGRASAITITSASSPGHPLATGGTPPFGSPGIMLPVTLARAVLLAETGSTGVLPASSNAVFVTLVVPFTLAVMWRFTVTPFGRLPMFQPPVPGV